MGPKIIGFQTPAKGTVSKNTGVVDGPWPPYVDVQKPTSVISNCHEVDCMHMLPIHKGVFVLRWPRYLDVTSIYCTDRSRETLQCEAVHNLH